MKRFRYPLFILLLSVSVLAQSDDVQPNENLVAEGIPKISAALAR